MDKSEIVLRYVGNGAFVTGVPARDLTAGDMAQLGVGIEDLLAATVAGAPVYAPAGAWQPPAPVIVIDTSDGIQDVEASAAGHVLSRRRKEK